MLAFRRLDSWMAHHFPATRAMARLGLIATVLSGLALAFHVGGAGGYALPLSYVLGAPTNMFAMRLINALHPIPHGALWSGADWNPYLCLLSACIALNWTLLGFLADVFGERPPRRSQSSARPGMLPEPAPGDLDQLAREFEELERQTRDADRRDETSHQRAA
jgi:hypothetical protein